MTGLSPAPSFGETSDLPVRTGVGLKPAHYRDVLDGRPDIGWFEVHPENYMGAGGPPHHFLERIRALYPLSLHGVGLSIGADRPLDDDHLQRLRELIRRYQPTSFSEHLAWSSHDDVFLNDLLPVPYTEETLRVVATHVDQVQDALGTRLLLENPSTYVAFAESTLQEIEFLTEVARRTGCGLLLDVNNVFVSAVNQGFDAEAYLDAFPMHLVGEVHLAGHSSDGEGDARLLIDAHDRRVDDRVWRLYERLIARNGPLPTCVEWDNDVPAWPVLLDEARRAQRIMERESHVLAS